MKHLDPDVLEQVNHLRLQALRIVDGVLAGLHKARHKGASVEFAEYREYAPGDDLRHIDWKALARTDRYYIKDFEQETRLHAILALDISRSMAFGAPTQKRQLAATLTASLALLLNRQGDAPGLLTFDQDVRDWLPPKAKASQLDEIFSRLLSPADRTEETAIGSALTWIAERGKRRGLVVLISDFLDFDEKIAAKLKVLAARGFDLALIHVIAHEEEDFPFEGMTWFQGMEADERILANPDDLAHRYRKLFGQHRALIEATAAAARAQYQTARTDQMADEILMRFLQNRSSRRRQR